MVDEVFLMDAEADENDEMRGHLNATFFAPESEIDIADEAQKERAKRLDAMSLKGVDIGMENALWLDAWNLAARYPDHAKERCS